MSTSQNKTNNTFDFRENLNKELTCCGASPLIMWCIMGSSLFNGGGRSSIWSVIIMVTNIHGALLATAWKRCTFFVKVILNRTVWWNVSVNQTSWNKQFDHGRRLKQTLHPQTQIKDSLKPHWRATGGLWKGMKSLWCHRCLYDDVMCVRMM